MPRKPARKTSAKRPAAVRRAARRPGKPGPSAAGRRKWRYAGALIISLLLLFAAYLVYLNQIIDSRFEGGAWALPSRVYARALELYPGLKLTREQLTYELELASYPRVDRQPMPGEYRQLGASLEFNSRPFEFADQPQAARLVQVFFEAGQVAGLVDSQNGNDLSVFRLPPLILGSYYPQSGEDRLLLAEDEVPERLLATLIAVEDRAFFTHSGVSPMAILRALWANLKAGKTVQGGSTLTQQLAKNLFLTPQKSLLRKINEAFLALLLELRFSKQAIVTAYINEVFLLQQNRIAIHGFARASRMLFGRAVDRLEVQHLALLVGMVKGPSRYNPQTAPELALERRNLVLKIMFERDLIDQQAFDRARAAPLGVAGQLPSVNPFPAYLDLVKHQLQLSYSGAELARRGLRIFTAFDPLLQQNLELGLARGLARFKQPELQAAVVIADYLNGDIQALVGDRVTDYPGFNRALMAQRPIGSLIKPLLLYSLLQGELTLASEVRDEPVRIQQSNGEVWEPRNYDRKLHGTMSLYEAFIHSYNLPFIWLGVNAGGLEALTQNLARIHLLKHEVVFPSILLGTTEMSAYEVAQMFQVIANDGFFTPLTTIRSVTDQHNQALSRIPLESFKLFDQATMIQVQRAMVGVSEMGTARYLAQRFGERSLAGKTGTTDDARDSWFVGFSDRLLSVVWLGRDDNTPIRLTGSSGALRVWADIMELQGFEPFKLSRDESLAWRYIDPQTGGISQQGCANSVLLPIPRDRIPKRHSRCQ
ncbi:MAG: penicillin-binding protein 1B [Gammaproteobacteria bacterium]|jgi:penicillin-binding protein 1B|nr:penicillin-binding protein 1B [Gammaproteobacteria bacterium]